MSNANLRKARLAKNDEFYTLYEDIEKEVSHYRDEFKNKTVYCNCDNPYKSNFCKFFLDNFRKLELKRFICTGYNKGGRGYILDTTNPDDYIIGELKGDGDFASDECKKLIEEADIICTNPPFSLLRKYVSTIYEFDKKFLFIGNHNTLSNKGFITLLMDNRLHRGYNRVWDFKKTNGEVARVNTSFWFTNFHKKYTPIELTEKYTPEKYPRYDNYEDAINVDKVCDIPVDYDGIMGVPLSFMHKHDPSQFDIVGNDSLVVNKGTRNFVINGRGIYRRLLIKKHQE